MIAQLDGDMIRTAPGRSVVRLMSYLMFEGRPLTTRGRFINPAVLAHLRMMAGTRPAAGQPHRPIFIVGMGRSGTTLMGRLLAVHPEVGFLNEPKALWHVVHPGEDVNGNYTLGEARLRMDAADATPEVIARARALFSYYSRLTRSPRVVDKNPELLFRIPFARAIFPDAIFVIAVRRGWDVIQSTAEWSRTKGVDGADWWGYRDRKWRILSEQVLTERIGPHVAEIESQEERAALEWAMAMGEAADLMSGRPAGVVVVRYEELVSEPRRTMLALLEQTGLRASASTIAFAERQVRGGRPKPPPHGLSDQTMSAVDRVMGQWGY